MTDAHPAAAVPDPLAMLRQALALLCRAGRDLLARHAARPAPRAVANPRLTRERRIARALEWLAALTATLAGNRTWRRVPTYNFPRFPGRFPSLTAKLRAEIGLPALPAPTPAQKAARHRRYMRDVFATQPTGRIVARLAHRLGLTEASEAWPHALVALTATPAALAEAARRRPAPPSPPPPQPAQSAPPDPTLALALLRPP